MSRRPKREYSRTFPTVVEGGRKLQFNSIDPELVARINRKAKREGVSLRALVLAYLTEWAEGGAR
jgi:predicted HicB family RNase H-like nuclease